MSPQSRLVLALALGASASTLDRSARADVDQTLVVVDTDDPNVVLESRVNDAAPWQSVCTGTCQQVLTTHATYRIGGKGIMPSRAFNLEPNGDRAIVHAAPRSRSVFTTGIVLTSVGVGAITTGIVGAAIVSASQNTTPCTTGPCGGFGFNPIPILLILGGGIVGLATLIPGIVMLIHNSHSRVRQAVIEARKEPMFVGPEVAMRGAALTLSF